MIPPNPKNIHENKKIRNQVGTSLGGGVTWGDRVHFRRKLLVSCRDVWNMSLCVELKTPGMEFEVRSKVEFIEGAFVGAIVC